VANSCVCPFRRYARFFLKGGEMPVTKARLTRTEQANYLKRVQELRQASCDVEIPSKWLNEASLLKIVVAGPPASTVYETPTGSVYYSICVRMVANQAGVTLLDCEGETEWDDGVGVLPSLQLRSVGWAGAKWHAPKLLLNECIENYIRFHHRGQFLEGIIWFSGLARIPEHYRDGMHAPFKLTFYDQFDRPIAAEGELSVQRAKLLLPTSSGPRLRRSLYDMSEPFEREHS
jgi:hypothetical protein